MSVEELRKRVEERIQEILFPRLMEKYKRFHMKHQWRECDCSYCEAKRLNHTRLKFAPYYLSYEAKQEWRDGKIEYCRATLDQESKRIL